MTSSHGFRSCELFDSTLNTLIGFGVNRRLCSAGESKILQKWLDWIGLFPFVPLTTALPTKYFILLFALFLIKRNRNVFYKLLAPQVVKAKLHRGPQPECKPKIVFLAKRRRVDLMHTLALARTAPCHAHLRHCRPGITCCLNVILIA